MRRIMIVDGSGASRELIARQLVHTIRDTEVTTCASAAEALARLETEHYNLITTALMLPDMDGLDLCRRIRRSRSHHYTPVIVISSDADRRLLREGFKAGVTDYFDKALGYKAFGDFIKAFLERNAGLVGRLLYVEDSRTAATLTTRLLEQHGLQVAHTPSAERALELLEEVRTCSEGGFDMVITDFHLEGEMSGGDLLHALRARHHYSQQELPVLVLTGNEEVQTQVEVFHAGANDFVNKPLVEEVLMARVRSLLLIKHQFDALKRQAADMEWLATTDTLTGVRNRRYLLDEGAAFVADPVHQPVWVVLIDLDHFKAINDNLGHLTGDRVLMEMGALLNHLFPDAMVVRFGGEEFVALLPGTGPLPAVERAEELRRQVESEGLDGVEATISIGMANTLDHPNADLNHLIGLADQALYAAKNGGRNRMLITRADRESAPPEQSRAALPAG